MDFIGIGALQCLIIVLLFQSLVVQIRLSERNYFDHQYLHFIEQFRKEMLESCHSLTILLSQEMMKWVRILEPTC